MSRQETRCIAIEGGRKEPSAATAAGTNPGMGTSRRIRVQSGLHRGLGRYASFAAGFSFISALTTVFQFFASGYAFGGPVFWAWPAVWSGNC